MRPHWPPPRREMSRQLATGPNPAQHVLQRHSEWVLFTIIQVSHNPAGGGLELSTRGVLEGDQRVWTKLSGSPLLFLGIGCFFKPRLHKICTHLRFLDYFFSHKIAEYFIFFLEMMRCVTISGGT